MLSISIDVNLLCFLKAEIPSEELCFFPRYIKYNLSAKGGSKFTSVIVGAPSIN